MSQDDSVITAGGAIFTKLKALGVDYVFVNSGTDFPPIVEGLVEAAQKNIELPTPVVIPHEHAAMGMAMGYYEMSGRCQAVMLHTNVGLSNGATGAINAACEHVPMLMMSGRTPVTEETRFGARTVPIGWGQEMRDQTALVREASKWDYELKFPEQISGVLDRAFAIANSTPKGPVYLSLPRETLCEEIPRAGTSAASTMQPAKAGPSPHEIEIAAAALAKAKRPLVIAQRGSGDADSFALFGEWAEEWGIPVCSWWATHLAIDTDHPCHVGDDPGPWLAEADVVLVLDSLAPWWPDRHKLADDAHVINMGPDPLFSRFPIRNFRSNLSIAGENADTIPALIEAMARIGGDVDVIKARRANVAEKAQANRYRQAAEAQASTAKGITKQWVSACLGEALKGKTSTVYSELGTKLGTLERKGHNAFFQEPHSGGLGWSFPAAMGGQLADRDRIIVATMGDGSYIFSNPTACHQIAEALGLPVLIIVLNNREWGAVRQSVVGTYPNGYAAQSNEVPLTSLEPSPDFVCVAQASRAWTRRVDRPEDVPGAIEAALEAISDRKQHALLEISILKD
ncbi:thiamine pyrophosphate-requiring protein [Hoeflea ulvae]|uniref:Thiamine pyrophosphate-requiring protein n=1 Tax=Hoeflea ulvae TaxID=2983764 RepID=A0ABT3YLG5_9HYPH|nr:thiamine pyrophosphate-requiring protein [Hoeflea ulvae]MCY0096743.1 thiamine pyrophosphate-requiring protein [Hoeflea ulvae]